MTREEAIKIIRDMAYLSGHIVDRGVEAFEFIEKALNQPSLPSTLEEAAEEYGKENTILPDNYNDGDLPDYQRWTADAFKAGAEWIARQGVSYEDVVCVDDVNDWLFMSIVETMVSLEDYFKDGDKVIVQIKKK